LILVDEWRLSGVVIPAQRTDNGQIVVPRQENHASDVICHCPAAMPEGKCTPFSDPILYCPQEISDAQPS
jgi:hypothetical protein